MVYRAKIGPSSDAFLRLVTNSTLYHMWHHRLYHPGQFMTDNVDKAADGVLSLKPQNPFV